mgnify:FL=1|jgi:uroporphyrinogen-III synthase
MKMILVTRPEPQNSETCKRLSDKGFVPIAWPVIAIGAVSTQDLPALDQPVDVIIFTSAHAVFQAYFNWQRFCHDKTSVLAVGPQTAKALAQKDVDNVLVPKVYHSEGLLAMPELEAVAGKTVLLMTGVGGRGLLDEVLVSRGAHFIRFNVYRRIQINEPIGADVLSRADAIQITSCDCLDALLANTSEDLKPALYQKTLLVKSERIYQYCLTKSFKDDLIQLDV